jgi:hypothetical protein
MKKPTNRPSFILSGGPKNVPLMLEQAGVRYATLFSSEKALQRFQLESCSLGEYQPLQLDSAAEVESELQKARKHGSSMLLVDPTGPEIDKPNAKVLAVFLRQLNVESPERRGGKKA